MTWLERLDLFKNLVLMSFAWGVVLYGLWLYIPRWADAAWFAALGADVFINQFEPERYGFFALGGSGLCLRTFPTDGALYRYVTLQYFLSLLGFRTWLYVPSATLNAFQPPLWPIVHFLAGWAVSLDPAYFEGLGLVIAIFGYILSVWVLLLIIRGGAPRYRIEQLTQYTFVGLLPAVAVFIVVVGLFLIIL